MCEYHIAKNKYKLKVSDHILDNIYGQIGLTEVERLIERLPLFKRLHNLSQLGLVKWIFPCALHTRYVHSIGVMHIAGEMAAHINTNMKQEFFSDSEIQLLRLAGLLHDIGHYPLSHNVEHAYTDAEDVDKYREDPVSLNIDHFINCPDFLIPTSDDIQTKDAENEKDERLKRAEKFSKGISGTSGLHHEYIGYTLIVNNTEIRQVIRDNFVLLNDEDGKKFLNPFFTPETIKETDLNTAVLKDDEIEKITTELLTAIGNIIIGNYAFELTGHYKWMDKYSVFVQLIHSDLDADNLDYLLRDATFSGTSYGVMDMGILLNCLYVKEFMNGLEDDETKSDNVKRYIVGITKKGIGPVEQFLLGKFMAYSQMIFSKYVSILEAMILRIASEVLIPHDDTHNVEKLQRMIEQEKTDPLYLSFSDFHIFNRLYEATRTANAQRALPDAILNRLIHSSAFDLADKEKGENEFICVGLNTHNVREEFKKSQLYQEFVEYYQRIKDKTGQQLIDENEEPNLFAYRFEKYELTSQLPFDIFEQEIITEINKPESRFNYHYYRLGKGIPILETDTGKQYSYFEDGSGKADKERIPLLCVDSPFSVLKGLQGMKFVALRKYKIMR